MKRRLSFAVLLALCVSQSTSKVPESLKPIIQAARQKCRNEVNLSDHEFRNWALRRKLPTTEQGKCCEVCACMMRELGYMTSDGQLNLATMKRLNELREINASIALANQIDEICTRAVDTAGKKPCEIAVEFRSCKYRIKKGEPPLPEASQVWNY